MGFGGQQSRARTEPNRTTEPQLWWRIFHGFDHQGLGSGFERWWVGNHWIPVRLIEISLSSRLTNTSYGKQLANPPGRTLPPHLPDDDVERIRQQGLLRHLRVHQERDQQINRRRNTKASRWRAQANLETFSRLVAPSFSSFCWKRGAWRRRRDPRWEKMCIYYEEK